MVNKILYLLMFVCTREGVLCTIHVSRNAPHDHCTDCSGICVIVCRVRGVSQVSPDSQASQDSPDLRGRSDPEEKRWVDGWFEVRRWLIDRITVGGGKEKRGDVRLLFSGQSLLVFTRTDEGKRGKVEKRNFTFSQEKRTHLAPFPVRINHFGGVLLYYRCSGRYYRSIIFLN